MIKSFAPGEIILFGEHSVVYGKNALAISIERGIEIIFSDFGSDILVESELGILSAQLDQPGNIKTKKAAAPLRPFLKIIQRCFDYSGDRKGFKAVITSGIPSCSGLASSASVSAAFIMGLLNYLGKTINEEKLLDLVFASELDIQKRGSIIGSACAVYGAMIEVSNNTVKRYPLPENLGEVVIANSKEKCPTSATTKIVKDKKDENPVKIQGVFDRMHQIACEGKKALNEGNLSSLGFLINENQRCLKELGVSTEKIDTYVSAVGPYVHGTKITGAGGGGCLFSIARDACIDKIAKIAEDLNFDIFKAEFRNHGVEVNKETV